MFPALVFNVYKPIGNLAKSITDCFPDKHCFPKASKTCHIPFTPLMLKTSLLGFGKIEISSARSDGFMLVVALIDSMVKV